MFVGDTKDRYPKPDGKYTFDKLSSVFITGNATRDDAPNHIRVQKHVPREIAETWRWMCPAGVYEIPDDAPEDGRRRRDRQLHELRAVRRDHGQGRPPDDARGRRRAALPDHLSSRANARRGRARNLARPRLFSGSHALARCTIALPRRAARGGARRAAQEREPLAARLADGCTTGPTPAARTATFVGADAGDARRRARMAMRFDLLAAHAGPGGRTSRVRRARRGASGSARSRAGTAFIYTKTVRALARARRAYRARVRFRWHDAAGRVQRAHAAHDPDVPRSPTRGRTSRVGALTAAPASAHGAATYLLDVRNTGRSAGRRRSTSSSRRRDAAAGAARRRPRAGRATSSYDPGPALRAGRDGAVVLDAGGAVDGVDEADDATTACRARRRQCAA